MMKISFKNNDIYTILHSEYINIYYVWIYARNIYPNIANTIFIIIKIINLNIYKYYIYIYNK